MSVGFLDRPSSPVKSKGCIPAFYGISKCFKDAIRRLCANNQNLRIDNQNLRIERWLKQLSSNPDEYISLIRLLFIEVSSSTNYETTNNANQSKAWKGLLELTLLGHERIRTFILGQINESWANFTQQQQTDAFDTWRQATDPSLPTNWPALCALQTCWDHFSSQQEYELTENWTTRLTPSSIDAITDLAWVILSEEQKNRSINHFIETKNIDALHIIFTDLSDAQQLVILNSLTLTENDSLQLMNFVLQCPTRTQCHFVRMVRDSIKKPYFARLIQASTELHGEESVCGLSRCWKKFTKEEQNLILLNLLINCQKPLPIPFHETFNSLFFELDPTQKSNLLRNIIIHFKDLNVPTVMDLVAILLVTRDVFTHLPTAQKLISLQVICCVDPPLDNLRPTLLYGYLSSDEKQQFIKSMTCLFVHNPATPALQQLVKMLIENSRESDLRGSDLESWVDYSRGLPYFERLSDILRNEANAMMQLQCLLKHQPDPSQSVLLSKWMELAMISPNPTHQMPQIVRLTEESTLECPKLSQLFNQTIQSGTYESIEDAARILIAIISTRSTKLIGFFCKWILDLKSHDQTILLRRLAWCFRDQKTVLDDWVSKASPSRSHQPTNQPTHQQNIRDILFATLTHDDVPYDDGQSPPILCAILSTQLVTLRNELKSQFEKWDDNQLIPVINQLRHILTSSRHNKIHFDSFDCLIELVTFGNRQACRIVFDIIQKECEADRYTWATDQNSATQCLSRLQSRFPTKESLPLGLKRDCSRFYTRFYT